MITIKQLMTTREFEQWNSFVQEQEFTLFTQSSANGAFYKSLGEQYWIFGMFHGDTLIGGSFVSSVHARRGNFLLLSYGPVLDFTNKAFVQEFFTFLKKFAKKEGYDFIRVSPFCNNTAEVNKLFRRIGFRKAPMHVLAENTWLLNLEPSEDELLKNMKKNHRNLIRRCEREGVRIETTTNPKNLSRFQDMHDVVAKRHKFHRFSRKFIQKEFDALSGKNNVVLYEAFLPDGQLDSAAIIFYFGNMAAYRHSASLHLDKRIPTSYLIQWHVIQEAKKRGKKWYNFWGIAPTESTKNHPFAGITHFKKGFNGEQKDLLPAQDLPISLKYWFAFAIETLRRIKRGF